MFVLASDGQATTGVKRIEEGVEVGTVVADRGQVDPFTLDDVLDQVFPDGGRRFGFDRIHVIPEALGTQGGRRGGWEMSPQDGLGEPVPHGSFAAWADRSVDRGDRQVLTGGQSLSSFGAMPVDMLNEFGAGGFLPEGLRQSPLEDLGGNGRWPSAVNGRDDVFELAEIFLPDASTAIVDAGPLGVIVVGMAVNLLGFQPFHRRLLLRVRTRLGHRKSDFKPFFPGKSDKKVRG